MVFPSTHTILLDTPTTIHSPPTTTETTQLWMEVVTSNPTEEAMPSSTTSDSGSSTSSSRMSSRIAFGSCNDQRHHNALWSTIESRAPAAFIWVGDAIYADLQGPTDWSVFPPMGSHICATPDRLRTLYQQQLRVPGYQALLQSKNNITIFGTLDDHDYGCNNADRTYPYKYESGMAFSNFLNLSPQSKMYLRAQAGHGVYGVKLFDFTRPAGREEISESDAGIDADIVLPDILPRSQTTRMVNGNHTPSRFSRFSQQQQHYMYSNRTVAVFVLDVRTNKTPWKKGFYERYHPDIEGDFLGERQWMWLQESMRRSSATIHIIVTGLQIHAYRFPDGNIAESWAHYPTAQQRLFDIVLSSSTAAPILISGDVHMAQLLRKDCVRKVDRHQQQVQQRSLVEMTTRYVLFYWFVLGESLSFLSFGCY
jgi:phosphodiesterase/alkaline phosphatase D-like protein